MSSIRLRVALLASLLLQPICSFGQDLLDIYHLAANTDPVFMAANSQINADKEHWHLALADMIPNVISSGNYKTVNNKALYADGSFDQYNGTITATQMLFSAPKINHFQQSRLVNKRIVAAHSVAEQSLLFRVTDRYFAILKAADAVTFSEQRKIAFSKQWQQSQERYKVGVSPVTDVHEAKARLDNAVAEAITASNTLHARYQQLAELTGEPVSAINPLANKPNLKNYVLEEVSAYEALAQTQNPALQQAELNTKIARKKVWEKRGEHLPTLDAFATATYDKTAAPDSEHQKARVVGLKASMDIFSGGKTSAATRQTHAMYQEEKANTRKVYLETMSDLRQAYYAVHNHVAKVHALEQAALSSEAALTAIRASHDVGNRSISDVLDAEADLLQAKQDLNAAYYDLLLADLELKQAIGKLSMADLEQINLLLRS